MGDVSTLFPSIHMYTTGAIGVSHGKDYFIENHYNACVNGAKAEVGLIYSLLSNNAKNATNVINNFTPIFKNVDEYLAHKKSLSMDKQTVVFNSDGTITIDYKN
jgi:hypothetical protein